VSRQKSSPRDIATLTPKTERRLNAYAAAATAAGVGLTALLPSTEAKVIYTPADQPIPLNSTYQLDLNNDGTFDFTLSNSGNTVGLSAYGNAAPNPQTGGFQAFLRVAGNDRPNQPVRKDHFAAALKPGRLVGPDLAFFRNRQSENHEMEFCQFAFDTSRTTYAGPWKDVQHRYLGLKFKMDGKVHYGWARLNVSATHCNIQARLTGYAYETVARKPITTGDKGQNADAKPAGLGQLAQGAAGKRKQ